LTDLSQDLPKDLPKDLQEEKQVILFLDFMGHSDLSECTFEHFESEMKQVFPHRPIRRVQAQTQAELKHKLQNLLEEGELISHLFVDGYASSGSKTQGDRYCKYFVDQGSIRHKYGVIMSTYLNVAGLYKTTTYFDQERERLIFTDDNFHQFGAYGHDHDEDNGENGYEEQIRSLNESNSKTIETLAGIRGLFTRHPILLFSGRVLLWEAQDAGEIQFRSIAHSFGMMNGSIYGNYAGGERTDFKDDVDVQGNHKQWSNCPSFVFKMAFCFLTYYQVGVSKNSGYHCEIDSGKMCLEPTSFVSFKNSVFKNRTPKYVDLDSEFTKKMRNKYPFYKEIVRTRNYPHQ
jgi:hypothetical protein